MLVPRRFRRGRSRPTMHFVRIQAQQPASKSAPETNTSLPADVNRCESVSVELDFDTFCRMQPKHIRAKGKSALQYYYKQVTSWKRTSLGPWSGEQYPMWSADGSPETNRKEPARANAARPKSAPRSDHAARPKSAPRADLAARPSSPPLKASRPPPPPLNDLFDHFATGDPHTPASPPIPTRTPKTPSASSLKDKGKSTSGSVSSLSKLLVMDSHSHQLPRPTPSPLQPSNYVPLGARPYLHFATIDASPEAANSATASPRAKPPWNPCPLVDPPEIKPRPTSAWGLLTGSPAGQPTPARPRSASPTNSNRRTSPRRRLSPRKRSSAKQVEIVDEGPGALFKPRSKHSSEEAVRRARRRVSRYGGNTKSKELRRTASALAKELSSFLMSIESH